MSNYPKKFDTTKIGDDDKQVLADFFERRRIFDNYLKENSIKLFTCPSCGYPTLSERSGYDICSICNWEDDGQDNETADEIWGGPNTSLSLTESRLKLGRELQELARSLKGTINLSPDEVLRILNDRDKRIDSFRKEKISMRTDISDPVWREYSQLEKNTLSQLIKK